MAGLYIACVLKVMSGVFYYSCGLATLVVLAMYTGYQDVGICITTFI